MPLFSIVIPTRNRAHLLRYALRSALEQTFDDYEIIVSNNHSSDDTERVIREHSDRKVRHVRTEGVLSMPDSWEFALSHTRGHYVTFLSDDDAICPSLLSLISSVLEQTLVDIVCWPYCQYYHETSPIPETRNTLTIPRFSGNPVKFKSSNQLRSLFRLRSKNATLPRMLNSCCSQNLIQEIGKTVGRFFLPPAPDFTACALQLASRESYVFLDHPLYIGGTAQESIGFAHFTKGKALQSFLEEFQEPVFLTVPLRGATKTNMIAESLLRAAHAFDGELSGYDLDWKRYFISYYNDLRRIKRARGNINKEREEFWRVVSEQSPLSKIRIRSSIAARMAKRIFRTRARKPQESLLIRGESVGFSNIYECSRKLDGLLSYAKTSFGQT